MRSGNGNAHPGAVDISIKEKTVDLPPNTPTLRKKRARSKKTKSAEEVEAGIQRVATYERQSLNDKLVNATPQALVAPVAPHNPTQSHDVSEEGDGGNVVDNTSYKPPSKGTDLAVTDDEVRGKCAQKKHVTLREDLESVTESDREPTPFKKVMGKRLVSDTNPMPMPKGKGQALIMNEDSATESDDDPPTKLMHASRAPAATDFNSERIQPVQTTNRLKLKLAPLAADPPQPTQSKSKSSRPKVYETKVKEVLKDAQEAFRKAQEAQKKAREDTRRVKENAKEPSVCNHIKALNEVEAGQSRLGQMSKGSKITTH